ncbi:chromosome segregation protein SMC [Caldibacillus lycopersici]|uniref:Chromosome partition protein Smc n=1 Tax=Perspicuibacillus lycopersici TaxID=1325689 RepID=A0AAE3IR28_9BACI|nr:chromosome segregation protein SMC [Perspicuibacillus lycopersici]MCU9612138.1 chromosome segregation protein SMC [Perspicuibacillus lycopersici]
MFLKRIDIVGFKSFAERMTIDFVQGVTAVVGPNGSGKSNIIDAIRWVLGEQSAKSLRGGKMEDIIFAGSDSRKALNFAEVALTLDNEDHFLPIDYNEVCITRRVYRSGESEFFINKQTCRLKDIVELLMDSGLGREAFSIISQGKVEEILNSKAEERRTIFEEAAGVLKYKTRKKKAEGKLEETEDNLNRVRDILHELEGQIEPLKQQASIAKDYMQKKEDLEQFEVSLLVYEIEQLHEKWEKLKAELAAHKDKEIELSSTLQSKEAQIHDMRDKIAALDDSIDQLQHVLLVTSEELEKLEGKKELLKERKKNAAQNRFQLEKAIEDGKQKVFVLEKEIATLTSDKIALEESIQKERTSLKEKQSQLEYFAEDIEEKIESLKSDYIELLNDQAAIKNEEQHVNNQLEQFSNKRERLVGENEKYIHERATIIDNKKKIAEQLKQQQEKIDEKIHQYRAQQRNLENTQTQFEKIEKSYYQALQFIQQAKSRKDILEEMEDDYSGFYQGVKEVLKAKDQLKGIEGAVAELINVEKRYEIAIEIALAASMQHVVVEKEEHARAAIQYLKTKHYGRATFLPLSVIKPKEIPSATKQFLSGHSAYVGIAAELLSFDKKYSNIMYNLLGNVIITKDLHGANELAKQLQYRFRIVTLDGDVVNPGGSMTGGAVKQKSSSLLSRKTELEALKTKLVEMEEKCASLEHEVKTKKQDIKMLEERLQQLREEGDIFRQEEQVLKDQLKEIEWNEKNINDKLAIYDAEEKDFIQEEQALLNKRNRNAARILEIQSQIQQIDQEIKELSEKRNSDQTLKATLVDESNELKIAIAKKEEQLRHISSQLEEVTARYEDVTNQLADNEQGLQLLVVEMDSSHSGKELLEEEAKQKLIDKNNTIQLISDRRKQRLEFQQKLEDIENEGKELKRQHKGLTELLVDEEVKLNRLDVDLENRLNVLREEYFLTYEGAKEQYPLTLPYEEARKKVKLIKLAIDELGTVNIGAIDEYERVSERYEFLSVQKDDLQNAKDTLFQVIEEMDEEMVKRFDETFTSIRDQFDSVFRSLFGGGRAELKLTNPDDLLNTGVEIIAQPPGKKLQNLALLSGGERALTAIALLFSILRVRPVPFCVLDEVEAALDEANVYRFSQYLKQFSQETQFIVITHRKGTMEEADVLYGVTMQESGVSKLVSVRLEETLEMV